MTKHYLNRTDLYKVDYRRSIFLFAFFFAFLSFFSLKTKASIPSTFTEITSAYDNFNHFNPSDSTTKFITYGRDNGSWAQSNHGCETGGLGDSCAINAVPHSGDYLGKTVTLEAGTYIFTYAVKVQNTYVKFRFTWDSTDLLQPSIDDYVIYMTTPDNNPGVVYESGEFTVTAGEYNLSAYITGAPGTLINLRLDEFHLYKENVSTTANTVTFLDQYWNSNDSIQIITETAFGSGITAPTVVAPHGWTFYGWKKGSTYIEDSNSDPIVIAPDSLFYPTLNTTYTAIYAIDCLGRYNFTNKPHSITFNAPHITPTMKSVSGSSMRYMFKADSAYILPDNILVTCGTNTVSPMKYSWLHGYFELRYMLDDDYIITIVPKTAITTTFNPSDGIKGIDLNVNPTITFSTPISFDGINIVDDASLQTVLDSFSCCVLNQVTMTNTIASGVLYSYTPVDFTASLSTDSTQIIIHPTTPLQEYTSYNFKLDGGYQIKDQQNQSSLNNNVSLESSFTTKAILPILETPTNFAITAINTDSVILSWNAVPNASSYRLERYYDDSRGLTFIDTISNLTSFTKYIDYTYEEPCIYKIYAIGEPGVNHDSELAVCPFESVRLTAPSHLSANVKDTIIILSWDRVEHALLYRIHIENNHYDSVYTTTNCSDTLINLSNYTSYHIEITAENGVSYINSESTSTDVRTLETVTVTLDAQNGEVNPSSMRICQGDTVNLPKATHSMTDWTFAGWNENPVDYTTVRPDLENIDYVTWSDITLYAVYLNMDTTGGVQTINYTSNPVLPKLCHITLDAGNGTLFGLGTSLTTIDCFNTQSLALLEAIPLQNSWRFAGWTAETLTSSQDSLPVMINATFTPTNDITLHAVYLVSSNIFYRIEEQQELTEGNSYMFIAFTNEPESDFGNVKALNNRPKTIGNNHYLESSDAYLQYNNNFINTDDYIICSDSALIWNIRKQTGVQGNTPGYKVQSQADDSYLTCFEDNNTNKQLITTANSDSASVYDIFVCSDISSLRDMTYTSSNHYIAYNTGGKAFCDIPDMWDFESKSTSFLLKSRIRCASTIENFTVNAHVNDTSFVLIQSGFLEGYRLDLLDPNFHDMALTGWSELAIDTAGTTIEPVYTTLPITTDKTIYAVYQSSFNDKFYTTIPNKDLIIDSTYNSISDYLNFGYQTVIVDENTLVNIDTLTDVYSVVLNPGSTLKQRQGIDFITDRLHIIAQDDNTVAVTIPQDSAFNVTLDYTIVIPDSSRYHFFSLPYESQYENIVVKGGNKGNIKILKYAPHLLADGHPDFWTRVSSWDLIEPNVGYSIISNLATPIKVTFLPVDSIFKFKNDNRSTKGKRVGLKSTSGLGRAENQGWNLVGSPYLDGLGKNQQRQLAHMKYVSQLNYLDSGKTYIQTLSKDAKINAFGAYFLQVDADTVLEFKYRTNPIAADTNLLDNQLKLSLTNQRGQVDLTYIDVQNQYTTDYEINNDLKKMLGQSTRPQFFSLSGEEQRAFNAIPESAMSNIDLGFYTGTSDSCIISADNANSYNAIHLYLTDQETATTTDLMTTSYAFNSVAGELNTTRFVLNIVRYEAPTSIDPISNQGVQVYTSDGSLDLNHLDYGSQVDIIDATGKIIYSQKVTDSSLCIQAAAGLYIIRVTQKDGTFTTYKTMIQ